MKSTNHLKRYALDIGGILLLLLIGFVLYTGLWRNLYWMLTPRPPVLLHTEWENSRIDSLDEIVTKNGYEYKVDLLHTYLDDNEQSFIAVSQTTNWYTDLQNAQYAWQNPQAEISKETYDRYTFWPFSMKNEATFLAEFYVKSLPPDISIPSSLRCYDWDEIRHTCAFFGYYEHWFTQIWFRSTGDNNVLTDELMFELIEKAVKIILEAPPPVQ